MAVPGKLRPQRPVVGKSVTSLQLPGSSGEYASAPDSAALSITGDLDLRCRVALTDWTPNTNQQELVGKSVAAGNQRAYRLGIALTTGNPILSLSSDGIAISNVNAGASTGFADGTIGWVRATWRASDGRVQFFTAAGSIATPASGDWTQVGTDQTLAVGSIKDSTAVAEVGATNAGTSNFSNGKFYRAQIYSGIDGTLVADFDATKVRKTATRTPATYVDGPGNTWTLNGSAWDWLLAA